MVRKKFGFLVGIGLLTVCLLFPLGSNARGECSATYGLMSFGDVRNDPMGLHNHIYPNSGDAGAIGSWLECYRYDTPRGSSQAGDPAECCGKECNPGRLFGDVNGDDIVNKEDAALILSFSAFHINTFPNMPTEMVPVSITTPQGPITGNEASILPGESAILRLQVNNISGIEVGNAEVRFTLSQATVGVTMDGLGVGVPVDKWTLSGLVAHSPSTPYPARVEGFGQVTVTIDSTPDTPFGSTAVVDVTCTGIPEFTSLPPVLGHRAKAIPALDPVSFIIHFGQDPVQMICELEDEIRELDLGRFIEFFLADLILEAWAVDYFFCQGDYSGTIAMLQFFEGVIQWLSFWGIIPEDGDTLIAKADEIIDMINQLPPGYQSPLCPGGCQP